MKKQKGITLIALIITIIVMLIMVGVTVNVALTGGLFDTARKAASEMKMAQIKEKAESIKLAMLADAESNKELIISKSEIRKKLQQELENAEIQRNKIVVENGKYDVTIKNENFEIKVVPHSEDISIRELIDITYTAELIKNEGENCCVELMLKPEVLISSEEYKSIKESQEEVRENLTDEQKKDFVLENLSNEVGEEFTSVDDVLVFELNSVGIGTHDTIEDWLEDPNLLDAAEKSELTKEELYELFFGEGCKTEEAVIENFYLDMTYVDYEEEYYDNTQNLEIYLIKDGEEPELLFDSIYPGMEKECFISENGSYKIELRATRNDNTIVADEILKINSLESENPYILTEEEAEGIWLTNGNGAIEKYLGNEKKVTIPIQIGNERINKIGASGCFDLNEYVEEVVILDNIKEISQFAFDRTYNLHKIRLSQNLEKIGFNAFNGCGYLEEIIIPEKVKEIGYAAFAGCTSLKEINIPNGVTKIEKSTFSNCTSLEKVTIPEGVTTIKEYAFYNCTALKNITIPNSVTSIKQIVAAGSAFSGCTNLTDIYFAPGDNGIPQGSPWGAPSNPTVTKLTNSAE